MVPIKTSCPADHIRQKTPMKKAYCIVEIVRIRNAEQFARYVAGHTPGLEKHGGRFLVKGCPGEVLEGRRDAGRVVVHEFPSLSHFRDWYDSEEYRPWKELRQTCADVNVMVVEGV